MTFLTGAKGDSMGDPYRQENVRAHTVTDEEIYPNSSPNRRSRLSTTTALVAFILFCLMGFGVLLLI